MAAAAASLQCLLLCFPLRRCWSRRGIPLPRSPVTPEPPPCIIIRFRCTAASAPDPELPPMPAKAVEKRTNIMQGGQLSWHVEPDFPSSVDSSTNSKSELHDVQKSAIQLLAKRAYTAAELKTKLQTKNFAIDIVEKVISDIKDRGFLDDGLYAESFSRSRWLSSTWGPRKIKQALVSKGVSEAEAEIATKKVFEADDSIRGGISECTVDRLFLQASKQWLRGQRLPIAKRRAKVVRWLQYRGFDWTVTNSIVRRLEAHYPQSE